MSGERACRKCKRKLPIRDFPFIHRARHDRRRGECVRCRRAFRRDYMRRRREDLHHRIRDRLTVRVRAAIARTGGEKAFSTMALVGCSIAELRAHIESLFLPGMSWDRLDEIEIDHIRPCASFDLSDAEQQRLCFHYTNLQPLWSPDNRSKGAKWAA